MYGIVPLWLISITTDYQGAACYILAMNYSFGWRKSIKMVESKRMEGFLKFAKNGVKAFLGFAFILTELYTPIYYDVPVGKYAGRGYVR